MIRLSVQPSRNEVASRNNRGWEEATTSLSSRFLMQTHTKRESLEKNEGERKKNSKKLLFSGLVDPKILVETFSMNNFVL